MGFQKPMQKRSHLYPFIIFWLPYDWRIFFYFFFLLIEWCWVKTSESPKFTLKPSTIRLRTDSSNSYRLRHNNYLYAGVEISQKFWGPFGPLVLKNWGPSIFCRARFGFSNIFCTSGIDMSQNFQGPLGPLVWTFCWPSPNFEGNWPRGPAFFQPLPICCFPVSFPWALSYKNIRWCTAPTFKVKAIRWGKNHKKEGALGEKWSFIHRTKVFWWQSFKIILFSSQIWRKICEHFLIS